LSRKPCRRCAIIGFVTPPETLPDDIAALQAALLAEREQRLAEVARIEAELAVAKPRPPTMRR
jgi:hypothetical protein